jgi:thiol-disulfide isomerase/thioredoxin
MPAFRRATRWGRGVGHRRSMTLLGLLAVVLLLAPAQAEEPVTVLFFKADGCPYCAVLADVLDDIGEQHAGQLVIQHFEVSGDVAARQRWADELEARGMEPTAVPTTILGARVWVGFSDRIADDIAAAIDAALQEPQQGGTEPGNPGVPIGPDPPPMIGDATTVDVPGFGNVGLADRSALATTALIAFVDGFNPCSLWVLTVLLAMVLNAGASRRRVAAVGGTFLVVTGLIYGAFIAGVFTVLGFIEYLDGIRVGVAALALIVGAVHLKDYVAFGRGFSFSIPDRFKPRIYRSGRAIRNLDRPLPAVLGLTVAMAAGISLVELPCTAGFPVVWSGIMITQGVEGIQFALLLGLYLLIYILDELVLFTVVVATLRITRFQETHGRLLKLIGGTVMIALGGVLLFAPEMMNSLTGPIFVIGGALVVALGGAAIHRWVGKRRTTP